MSALAVVAVAALAACSSGDDGGATPEATTGGDECDWPIWGQSVERTFSYPCDTDISPDTVGDLELQPCGHPREPAGSPGQRLDEVQLEVRSGYGERQPGQTRSGSDVDDALPTGTGRNEVVDQGAIEDVAFPESRRLSRADEAVADAGVGQHPDELLGAGQVLTEDGGRGGRGVGHAIDGAFRLGGFALESDLAAHSDPDVARTLLLYVVGHTQATQLHRQAAAVGIVDADPDLDASFERGLAIILC